MIALDINEPFYNDEIDLGNDLNGNNIIVQLKLEYRPIKNDKNFANPNLENRWYANIKYNDISRTFMVTNSFNLCQAWQNIIPVFLACFTKDQDGKNVTPCFAEAFSTGAYLLMIGRIDEYQGFLNIVEDESY